MFWTHSTGRIDQKPFPALFERRRTPGCKRASISSTELRGSPSMTGNVPSTKRSPKNPITSVPTLSLLSRELSLRVKSDEAKSRSQTMTSTRECTSMPTTCFPQPACDGTKSQTGRRVNIRGHGTTSPTGRDKTGGRLDQEHIRMLGEFAGGT